MICCLILLEFTICTSDFDNKKYFSMSDNYGTFLSKANAGEVIKTFKNSEIKEANMNEITDMSIPHLLYSFKILFQILCKL